MTSRIALGICAAVVVAAGLVAPFSNSAAVGVLIGGAMTLALFALVALSFTRAQRKLPTNRSSLAVAMILKIAVITGSLFLADMFGKYAVIGLFAGVLAALIGLVVAALAGE